MGKAEINGFIHKYICDYLMIRLRIPHIVGNKKKGNGFIKPSQISGEFTHKCFHDRDIDCNPLLIP
jgi:hypothetical protein